MQIDFSNVEEFLARYALYSFLKNPADVNKITTIFGIDREEVGKVLNQAVQLGFLVRPTYEEGVSQGWFYAWGYLYASSLFLTEEKPTATSLFNSTDMNIIIEAQPFLADLGNKTNKMRKFFTPEQLRCVGNRF